MDQLTYAARLTRPVSRGEWSDRAGDWADRGIKMPRKGGSEDQRLR
jgi:hypothetical protein